MNVELVPLTSNWYLSTDAYDRTNKEKFLQTSTALNQFLASVERRALRMAEISVGNRDDALDIVQDTMIRLVKHYRDKPADQWLPLFFRILNNRITDHHRRGGVVQKFKNWFAGDPEQGGEVREAAGEGLTAPGAQPSGEEALQSDQRIDRLEQALAQLPDRQQQAFMLRCWEGLSTRDTATAMGCSEGSVKTHYSRAIHQLRNSLEGVWP